jgi:hypothetical protein
MTSWPDTKNQTMIATCVVKTSSFHPWALQLSILDTQQTFIEGLTGSAGYSGIEGESLARKLGAMATPSLAMLQRE